MKSIKEKSCWIIPFMIIDGNINFLIVKHNLWHWGFPKWHVEIWETEKQTAKRELFEETWINNVKIVNNYRLVEEYDTTINWKKIQKTVIYFLWKILVDNAVDNTLKISILKSEISNYLIDSYDNVIKLITYDSSKKNFKKVFYFLKSMINA